MAVAKIMFSDYIDYIIVATSVSLKEDLVTEDSRILAMKKILREKFGVTVSNYQNLIK